MNTISRLLPYCLLLLLVQTAVAQKDSCKSSVRFLSTFRWTTASERAIINKNVVMRANIPLSSSERLLIDEAGTTTIRFPYSGEPKAELTVVSGTTVLLHVTVPGLPGFEQDKVFADNLRPISVAQLCGEDAETIVVVAFGSGATGESQFFLTIVGRKGQYRYFSLPVASRGRLKLSIKEPRRFELWSAIDSPNSSNGGRLRYSIESYELSDSGFQSISTSKTAHTYSADDISNQPIVLTNLVPHAEMGNK